MSIFKLATFLFVFLLPLSVYSQTNADTTKKPKDNTNKAKDTTNNYVKNRFSEYEPNYFISQLGSTYYGHVKFKISFKFDLSLPYTKNKAFFAFTQTAFWDLYGPSAPMRELDFTPTLFFEHDFYKESKLEKWHFEVTDFKIGYLHQSDGQPAGPLNRSIFKITGNTDLGFHRDIRGQSAFGLDVIDVSVRTWIWNMVDEQNKNIADYQGYGQLIGTLKFDYNNKSRTTGYRSYPFVINNVITPAKKGITNELNVFIDPFIGIRRAPWFPYLIVQYFHGYGENLINYDNRYNNFKALDEYRFGVLFRVY